MSRLLALDQASHITGWAVFDGAKLLKHGIIYAKSGDMGDRLYYIKEEIIKLLEEYQIDEVAFEDIQMQTSVGDNVKTFKILAEVFGVLEELFAELKYPHTAILSSTWKSTLGIRGRKRAEQKANAKNFVETKYNIKVTQDEADAICIGTHYLNQSINDWSD